MTFTSRLRHRRKELRLYQRSLASACGVSLKTFNKWERGETFPDVYSCSVWARRLGMSLEIRDLGHNV